jgi:hypothetical protein
VARVLDSRQTLFIPLGPRVDFTRSPKARAPTKDDRRAWNIGIRSREIVHKVRNDTHILGTFLCRFLRKHVHLCPFEGPETRKNKGRKQGKTVDRGRNKPASQRLLRSTTILSPRVSLPMHSR